MRGVQLHPTAIAPANNVTKSFLKLDPVSGPAASHLMTGLPVSLLRKRTRKIAFSIQGRPDASISRPLRGIEEGSHNQTWSCYRAAK